MTIITGKTLNSWGFKGGSWFKEALPKAQDMAARGCGEAEIRAMLQSMIDDAEAARVTMRVSGVPVSMNIHAEGPDDASNIEAVEGHLKVLAKLPTVTAVAAMPDACPSGLHPGTIPVGGVVTTENAVHPAMHSADICCSVALTVIGESDPKAVLDAAQAQTHFGPGSRGDQQMPGELVKSFKSNPFLEGIVEAGNAQFATQGDGNHFLYVGRLASTGETALVTHHGSRKPGALLYKKGKAQAEKFRRQLAPEIEAMHGWLPMDTQEGQDYWQALQIIREWTKANHERIHDLTLRALGKNGRKRFWNEHNFVFERDGLYHHAKGATPAWADFAADSSGQCLIPLNMGQPILIVEGLDADNGLGFCPHGAGRNFGRKAFLRRLEVSHEAYLAEQTKGLDVRFFCGEPDLSELPGAYKDAHQVRRQIDHYGLARIVDEVLPYGSIMAGDWQVNAPWRNKN